MARATRRSGGRAPRVLRPAAARGAHHSRRSALFVARVAMRVLARALASSPLETRAAAVVVGKSMRCGRERASAARARPRSRAMLVRVATAAAVAALVAMALVMAASSSAPALCASASREGAWGAAAAAAAAAATDAAVAAATEADDNVAALGAENERLRVIVRTLRGAFEAPHEARNATTATTTASRSAEAADEIRTLLFTHRQDTGGSNANLVLECADVGRLLYRFTCPTGSSSDAAFTGVGTCE